MVFDDDAISIILRTMKYQEKEMISTSLIVLWDPLPSPAMSDSQTEGLWQSDFALSGGEKCQEMSGELSVSTSLTPCQPGSWGAKRERERENTW